MKYLEEKNFKIDKLSGIPDSAMMTIDLEDWNQLIYRKLTGRLVPPNVTMLSQTARLLEFLDLHGIKATFFVLGFVAEGFPSLIREIHAQGHEIASHGFSHRLATHLGIADFRQDVERSLLLLEDIIGEKVIGFRSPEFSIRKENLVALKVLAELGVKYDSSIFPILHRRYGYPGFPRSLTRVSFQEHSIYEIPLTTVSLFGQNMPIAGGGYFRFLPGYLLKLGFKRVNKDKVPIILYFHPYEFDNENLNIGLTSNDIGVYNKARVNIIYNLRRKSILTKLDIIVSGLNFSTCREVINHVDKG